VLPRSSSVVGASAHRVDEFGGDNELITPSLEPAADDLFGYACLGRIWWHRIRVGCVQESEAQCCGFIKDGERL
jgi:hypothetical protein